MTSDLQLICPHPSELCAWTAHARVRGRVTLAVPLPVCKEGIYWPTHLSTCGHHRWRIVFNCGCRNTHRLWPTPIPNYENTHCRSPTPITPIHLFSSEVNSFPSTNLHFRKKRIWKQWRVNTLPAHSVHILLLHTYSNMTVIYFLRHKLYAWSTEPTNLRCWVVLPLVDTHNNGPMS